ncbi:hypothetical protein [Leptospira bouyouniensis]|uniref:hypothetical protein n=1 Tax=Leptospira bouyouniensis TaxID=2484911 RepID=UPI0010912F13|nr:hypothetical protein [Leptospira bouyouniensis]TGM88271.1 hypothetical protein EHQ99_00200 [Leptospira bouyouniensis]
MRYITLLALIINCAVSSSDVKNTTTATKKERIRNSAIWGSEEDVKMLDYVEGIASESIKTLDTEINEILEDKYIDQKRFDIDTDLWKGLLTQSSAEFERNYVILWHDDSRNEFLVCYKKYLEWESLAKKQKDYFSKNLCNIPVQLEFYKEELGEKVCLGNSNLELNFSSYSIAPFTELQFMIPETKVYGDGCNNFKIKEESYRVGSDELKKMAKVMSDESIKKFSSAAIAKKKKINATYK